MKEIVVLRHPSYRTGFYNVVVKWAHRHFRRVLRHFRFRTRTWSIAEWSDEKVLVPWLQDPVESWSTEAYEAARRLQDAFDARGLKVLNRVERLSLARRDNVARVVAALGIRTPRVSAITDPAQFPAAAAQMGYPMFVRENIGHDVPFFRLDAPAQVHDFQVRSMTCPVATEIIDVCSKDDGLFRKYRYFACGEIGISQHLQVSREWVTRGKNRLFTPTTRAEEIAYIGRADPNHERLQSVRRALGLDMVAIDYGYTCTGELVVWEVNSFPFINFGKTTSRYRNIAIHRSIAAMVTLYLTSAGLPLPRRLRSLTRYAPEKRAGVV